MKQIPVELGDEVAAKLEEVAPARTGRRSEFIRAAIRKALWDIEEQATAEAYRAQPDPEAYVHPAVWDRHRPYRRSRR